MIIRAIKGCVTDIVILGVCGLIVYGIFGTDIGRSVVEKQLQNTELCKSVIWSNLLSRLKLNCTTDNGLPKAETNLVDTIVGNIEQIVDPSDLTSFENGWRLNEGMLTIQNSYYDLGRTAFSECIKDLSSKTCNNPEFSSVGDRVLRAQMEDNGFLGFIRTTHFCEADTKSLKVFCK